MKTLITSLGLAAALSVSVISSSAVAGAMAEGWAACNAEYAACLKGGTDTSIASTPGDAMSQGQANMSNWASCNSALSACYKSLR